MCQRISLISKMAVIRGLTVLPPVFHHFSHWEEAHPLIQFIDIVSFERNGSLHMRFRSKFISLGLTALLGSMVSTTPIQADEVADFYKGKNVSIVVAARAGGGHSNYSLFVGKYWKKHMPGNPTFIIQNLGGAGGTKAAKIKQPDVWTFEFMPISHLGIPI
jgi:hypothetical protein